MRWLQCRTHRGWRMSSNRASPPSQDAPHWGPYPRPPIFVVQMFKPGSRNARTDHLFRHAWKNFVQVNSLCDDGNGISWGCQHHEGANSAWTLRANHCGIGPECSWRQAEGPEGPVASVVTTGSHKKNLERGRATCQYDVGAELLEVSWIPLAALSMKQISADFLFDADQDVWHLGPAGSRSREK